MNDHFGSPAFFFYPPLLQWVGGLFAPVLPGAGNALRRLVAALGLLSVVGAQGCRCWIRSLGGSGGAATLAGALWLVAPYRVFVDVYQRNALAECASLCLLPWLGSCAVRLAQGRRGAWSWHALAVAALAYTHMPGMLIGYLFAGCHAIALIYAAPDARRKRYVAVSFCTSGLVGLAVAGAMLLPALSLLGQIVDPAAMSGERNQPHNWLLFSGMPWIDPVARLATMGVMAMTLGLAAMLTAPAVREKNLPARRVGWAMVATILIVSALNLGISRPFWDLNTPLSRIQFPFRLLGASSLAVCALGGLAYDRMPRYRAAMLWLLLAGLLLGDMAALAYQRLRPRDHQPPTVAQIMASNEDTSEYVLGDLPAARQRFAGQLAFAPGDPTVVIDKASIGYRYVTVDYHAHRATALALHQFAFTGWNCRVDSGAWSVAGTFEQGERSRPARTPLCAVPAGRHRLEARLPATLPEVLGTWLSFAGGLCLILSFAIERKLGTRLKSRAGV